MKTFKQLMSEVSAVKMLENTISESKVKNIEEGAKFSSATSAGSAIEFSYSGKPAPSFNTTHRLRDECEKECNAFDKVKKEIYKKVKEIDETNMDKLDRLIKGIVDYVNSEMASKVDKLEQSFRRDVVAIFKSGDKEIATEAGKALDRAIKFTKEGK